MRRRAFVSISISSIASLLLGCDSNGPVDVRQNPAQISAGRGGGGSSSFATLIALPTLKGNSETRAVNRAGTVIAGYASEPRGIGHPVKWTLQADGSWALTVLPFAATATGGIAMGVNDAGDAGGSDNAGGAQALFWPAAGGFNILGCGEPGTGDGLAMTAGAQAIVGRQVIGQALAVATIWRPGSCAEALPPLIAGGGAAAYAVNEDATVVGGGGNVSPSTGGPLRWTRNAGTWQVEQLDQRSGIVTGANAAGDLVGFVYVPCAEQSGGCQRPIIWYRAGGSRELGTLGGALSWAHAINGSGEVVGGSSLSSGVSAGYFWSEWSGMIQLPVPKTAVWVAPFAISDVRADGTRLVAGVDSRVRPIAWIVRNP